MLLNGLCGIFVARREGRLRRKQRQQPLLIYDQTGFNAYARKYLYHQIYDQTRFNAYARKNLCHQVYDQTRFNADANKNPLSPSSLGLVMLGKSAGWRGEGCGAWTDSLRLDHLLSIWTDYPYPPLRNTNKEPA